MAARPLMSSLAGVKGPTERLFRLSPLKTDGAKVANDRNTTTAKKLRVAKPWGASTILESTYLPAGWAGGGGGRGRYPAV
jgi:hypothetical protein